jgi:dihydrofolate reductase
MSRTRIHGLAISIDGYATGEDPTPDAPFGHAGRRLLDWFIATRTFQAIHHEDGGSTGIDDSMASNWGTGIGAEIMGRNKFGPQRGGPWLEDGWKGWWGDNPPFGTPVFVLTHFPRPPIELEGGNSFHFIDASPAEALAIAKDAAGGLDVRIGGGPTMIREFLADDLVDYMHIAIVPIVLGRGLRLWDGLEGVESRFEIEVTASPSGVTHMVFSRK